jgi:prepilin-type N-terminal cleavage/methylation domain-containing protein
MRRSLRQERGFTLIEVLIAMTLMSVGVAATLGVFGSAGRTTLVAQQNNVAVQQAQAEVDRLSRLSYDTLGLTSTPATSTNPRNPGYRVSGTALLIKTGLSESFVLSSDAGQSAAAVDPAPTSFAVGLGDATITGSIYRYVTWRDENCPTGVCDGTQNTKRITVAVTINQTGTGVALNPTWVSTVLPDPDSVAPGATAPGGGGSGAGSTVSAQDFYLYDTRCNNSSRQAQTGSHATHSSASWAGASPYNTSSYYSVCENNTSFAGATIQPDLMGTSAPPGDSSTPLYTYSSELSGAYDGGLAMKRQGTSCRTNYSFADSIDATKPNAWSVHAWATSAFSSAFNLDGIVTLSLFTETLGGASGRGFICATLVDRSVASGVPTDTTIGSTTFDLASWPTSVRRLSFSFKVGNYDIPTGHRLVLALNVRSESANDLVFRYDHPLYPSFLELATSTPF